MRDGGGATLAGGGGDAATATAAATGGRKRKRGAEGGSNGMSSSSKGSARARASATGAMRSLLGSLAVCVAWSEEVRVESQAGNGAPAACGLNQTQSRPSNEVQASPVAAEQASEGRAKGAGRVPSREAGHSEEEPILVPGQVVGKEGGEGIEKEGGEGAGEEGGVDAVPASVTVSCLAVALQSGDVALIDFPELHSSQGKPDVNSTAPHEAHVRVPSSAPAPAYTASATGTNASSANHHNSRVMSSREPMAGYHWMGEVPPPTAAAPPSPRLLLRFRAHRAPRVTAMAWHSSRGVALSSLLLFTGASDGR